AGGGGGGGGGSFVASSATDPFTTAGVNGGDGSVDIVELAAAVPEPASWALMLAGFFGLGAALRARRSRIPA
ncbi:MAG: PEPxxWA-CTERM sorting domain-containing protein, partial [Caulobacteraceae bacterium]